MHVRTVSGPEAAGSTKVATRPCSSRAEGRRPPVQSGQVSGGTDMKTGRSAPADCAKSVSCAREGRWKSSVGRPHPVQTQGPKTHKADGGPAEGGPGASASPRHARVAALASSDSALPRWWRRKARRASRATMSSRQSATWATDGRELREAPASRRRTSTKKKSSSATGASAVARLTNDYLVETGGAPVGRVAHATARREVEAAPKGAFRSGTRRSARGSRGSCSAVGECELDGGRSRCLGWRRLIRSCSPPSLRSSRAAGRDEANAADWPIPGYTKCSSRPRQMTMRAQGRPRV